MKLEDLKDALADELKGGGYIRSAPVEAAFRAVDRHLFVPEVEPEAAYRNEVIPLKVDGRTVESSASQPAIVATMLEQLGLRPGQRVLEVGAGSGYNAALMAHVVGGRGRVVTVEIEAALARRARERLAAAGFGRVEVVHGDGMLGYPEAAPYDRVVLTALARDVAPAWREQLRPDGRLLLPLEVLPGLQVCVAFEPAGDHLTGVSARWCGFLRLRGPLTDREEAGRMAGDIALGEELRRLRDESLESGRAFPKWLRIRAYTRGVRLAPASGGLVVERRWTRFVLDRREG